MAKKTHLGNRKLSTTVVDAHIKPIARSLSYSQTPVGIGRFSNKGPGVKNIFAQRNY